MILTQNMVDDSGNRPIVNDRYPRICRLLLFLLPGIFSCVINVQSQQFVRPKNSLTLSFFGEATGLAVNYERLFLNREHFFLSGSAGIGFSNNSGVPSIYSMGGGNTKQLLTVPLHFTGNVGGGKHYLEFGLSGTILFDLQEGFYDYGVFPMIGYRLQPMVHRKANFRIFFCWPVSTTLERISFFFLPFGLSVGCCF